MFSRSHWANGAVVACTRARPYANSLRLGFGWHCMHRQCTQNKGARECADCVHTLHPTHSRCCGLERGNKYAQWALSPWIRSMHNWTSTGIITRAPYFRICPQSPLSTSNNSKQINNTPEMHSHDTHKTDCKGNSNRWLIIRAANFIAPSNRNEGSVVYDGSRPLPPHQSRLL